MHPTGAAGLCDRAAGEAQSVSQADKLREGVVMHWYLDVLKKYAVFSGRARRKEYWFFALFSLIITLVLMIIDAAAGVFDAESGFGLLSGFYTLAVLIPGLAVSIRRLHDTNHSGWWLLIGLVPLVGSIMLLIFMFRDGQPGQNRFGPNPKELATSTSSVVATAAGHVMTRTQDQAPMAFCISCGTNLPEAAAYCPKCGARRTA
jgi:uncharacterized membrane protein YhaH (DUF805 family)